MMVRVLLPGTLWGYATDPNPNGACDSLLFALTGDATAGPIQEILWDPAIEAPKPPCLTGSQPFSLRIYHFNDLHGHLVKLTKGGHKPIISRLAGEIKSARKSILGNVNKAILVFTAGDDRTGSIFDEMMHAEAKSQSIHPGYRLYSKIGVDAAVLGNHDLDRGTNFLKEAISREARFPILAANLSGCSDLQEICLPAVILVIKGIRVGLIGLVTRAENHLDPSQCKIIDPITTAKNLLPAIRPFCDVLIILSHLGFSLKENNIPMADAGDVELANSLPTGLADLIIGGHSHHALNLEGLSPDNVVNGIPIVQAGAMGEYLGQVDITVQENHSYTQKVQLVPIESLPIDQYIEETEMRPLLLQATKMLERKLGVVETNSALGSLTVKYDFARTELALSNFVTDALASQLAKQGLFVDLVMIDSSALQSGLPVGEVLTLRDWFKVMPYCDSIRLYTLTPRQLEGLLRDNALRIDLSSEDHVERGFLQFSHQLRYQVSVGIEREETNVKNITLEGIPLGEFPKKTLTIATTNFIRQSARDWECSLENPCLDHLLDLNKFQYTETEIYLRQEMVAYIQDHNGITKQSGALRDGRLKFLISGEQLNRKSLCAQS